MKKYYCTKCEREHKVNSGIGKEHAEYAKTEEKKQWTKVTDMRVITFLKDQVKRIKGSLIEVTTGTLEIANREFIMTTYKGKGRNSFVTKIKEDDKQLNYYLLSFENGEFLNVGKLPHKK